MTSEEDFELDFIPSHKIIGKLKSVIILDKIRTEIENLPTTKCTETHRIYIDAADFKKNVLAIIDKHKEESEE